MIRALGMVLFILYVLALIYFLFFSEEYGRNCNGGTGLQV